ncbi:MAG: peptidoglycan-binding domain-containing protein [Patescibacteria group bacterium]
MFKKPSIKYRKSAIHVLVILGASYFFFNLNSVQAQTNLPLVQQADIEYLGGFTLPQYTQGDYRFGYGGEAVGYYKDASGRESLYLQGHNWYKGQVAQVQIPSTFSKTINYPRATLLQGFKDMSDGNLKTAMGDGLGSILSYKGKLVVGFYTYYDASVSQKETIGTSGFDLNVPNDFKGFYKPVGINPGKLGRYMTTVPSEWQSLLGGPALSGACCLSIISRTNTGPGVSVFNPDDIGTIDPVPFKEILGYTLTNNLKYGNEVGNCTGQSSLFNCTTSIVGIAFPSGTRSLLFFGTQGIGPNCYKEIGEPSCRGSGGYNAPPYVFQIWAYDVNDLVAVKNGTKIPYEVRPYAIWQMNMGFQGFAGGAFDPATNRMFLVQINGEDPIVRVLKINIGTPAGQSTIPKPSAVSSPSLSETLPIISSTVITTTSGGITLTRNMYVGHRGADVIKLQNFLIKSGYLALGNNTGYFGILTRAAVRKYQCEKGIVCSGDQNTTGYGIVGPRTRMRLLE